MWSYQLGICRPYFIATWYYQVVEHKIFTFLSTSYVFIRRSNAGIYQLSHLAGYLENNSLVMTMAGMLTRQQATGRLKGPSHFQTGWGLQWNYHQLLTLIIVPTSFFLVSVFSNGGCDKCRRGTMKSAPCTGVQWTKMKTLINLNKCKRAW